MNCLIIGFGHYATHEYIKLINRNKVALTHVVDLIPCESRIRAALKKSGIHEVSFLGMTPKKGKSTFILSKTESKQLDDFIKGRSIDFVIISTDPISHFAYCKWALENRLNILLDKPAVLRRNVSINLKAAKGIYSDFVELSELYRKARLQNNSLEFVISAQRRFSPAMKYIEEEMGKVADRTGVPVTSMYLSKNNGNWKFPRELMFSSYHGFNQGYGVCAHSGYHLIDMVAYLSFQLGSIGKMFDNVQVFAHCIRPSDLLEQFSQEDYKRSFGSKYKEFSDYSPHTLRNRFRKMGEVDAFVDIRFRRGRETLRTARLSFQHNTFSKRSWVLPPQDLYVNGKQKLEYHSYEQGPFQSIQFVRKKAHGKSETEMIITRNTKVLKGKALEKISFRENYRTGRYELFEAFLHTVKNQGGLLKSKSTLMDHEFSHYLLSGIYQSLSKFYQERPNLITLAWPRNA